LNADDFAAAATPQEVADALAFLASDRGSGVNGALVDLNAREVD
jgi:NAD(P)-dependent dehydrogenase (short-subunit alcohol dehydrogenase family)